jgi:hypothetical protein
MTKTILLEVLLIALLASCQQGKDNNALVQAENTFNEAAETEAIMKVIEGETKCFFESDTACWASHWSHKASAMQAWNNDDGTAGAAIGWDNIYAQGKDWIEKYYKNGEVVIHPVVKREKPVVTFFNDSTAYLIWKQYNADQEKKFYRISREMRILEKEEGWKILTVAAFWDTEAKIPFDNSLRIDE